MKTIQVKLEYNNGHSEEVIKLNEQDALRLFKWTYDNSPESQPSFYDDKTGKPWKVGRVWVPEDFSTEDFWDNSNGRDIADKWGFDNVSEAYYFTLDDYEKLKAELEANPHWKVWNESLRYWQYNVELEIVEANGELE